MDRVPVPNTRTNRELTATPQRSHRRFTSVEYRRSDMAARFSRTRLVSRELPELNGAEPERAIKRGDIRFEVPNEAES